MRAAAARVESVVDVEHRGEVKRRRAPTIQALGYVALDPWPVGWYELMVAAPARDGPVRLTWPCNW